MIPLWLCPGGGGGVHVRPRWPTDYSVIQSDQGREFENKVMQELCLLCGVHKTRTTPYHPESDVLVERFSRTLLMMLAMVAGENKDNWDGLLPAGMMVYRSSVHSGCAFRNTSYRSSDYDAPSGEFGLPVHHPRFLEWIGVPHSACLLEIGAGRWVNHLSRDQAVAAAVNLQRDVGLMQTNLDVLDQYSLALQGTASKLIELCLGAWIFPAEEVAAGALGPRARRASVQMEAMGLWRLSLDPLRLH